MKIQYQKWWAIESEGKIVLQPADYGSNFSPAIFLTRKSAKEFLVNYQDMWDRTGNIIRIQTKEV